MSPDVDVSRHLDGEVLRALLDMVGDDPEFVGELVDTFIADSPAQLAAIRSAIAAGSPEELVRPAHTLKGNSVNLGAPALAAICRDLEAQARAGSLDGAADRLTAAEAEYRDVVEALGVARQRRWRIE